MPIHLFLSQPLCHAEGLYYGKLLGNLGCHLLSKMLCFKALEPRAEKTTLQEKIQLTAVFSVEDLLTEIFKHNKDTW